MIGDAISRPGIEAAVVAPYLCKLRRAIVELLIIRITEAARDLRHHRRVERERAVLDALPFCLDFLGEGLGAKVVHQDLDARLPNVVAAAELIVGAQHRLDIREHIPLGQEWFDGLGEIGRTAQSAADHHFESGFTCRIAMQP